MLGQRRGSGWVAERSAFRERKNIFQRLHFVTVGGEMNGREDKKEDDWQEGSNTSLRVCVDSTGVCVSHVLACARARGRGDQSLFDYFEEDTSLVCRRRVTHLFA